MSILALLMLASAFYASANHLNNLNIFLTVPIR